MRYSRRFSLYWYATKLLYLGIFFSSCIQTKGYLGPELEKSKVSTIYFFGVRDITLHALKVDNTQQGLFDTGIDVLPGKHDADVNFEIKEIECSPSFLSTEEYCYEKLFRGGCRASFTSEAGKTYAVEVSGVGQEAFISVLEKHSRDVVGVGDCEIRNVAYDYSN